jgi:hypothetical protein
MPIAKEKSPKPFTRLRADRRVAPGARKRQPDSTEQIAERFCEEMIQNLKRNVAETKHRPAL